MDGNLSALNFTTNAASQHWTCTFQPDVLPRWWQGPSTSSIWSGRCSHICDVTLYFLAWLPCVLQVLLQFCNSTFSSVVQQRMDLFNSS